MKVILYRYRYGNHTGKACRPPPLLVGHWGNSWRGTIGKAKIGNRITNTKPKTGQIFDHEGEIKNIDNIIIALMVLVLVGTSRVVKVLEFRGTQI